MIKEVKHKCLLFNNNKSLNNVLLHIDMSLLKCTLPHPPPLMSYLAKLVQFRKAKTWAPIDYIYIVYVHCFLVILEMVKEGDGR